MATNDSAHLYQACWEIEMEADTPLAAAKQARARLLHVGAKACKVAEITPYAINLYGKPVTIDMARENT